MTRWARAGVVLLAMAMCGLPGPAQEQPPAAEPLTELCERFTGETLAEDVWALTHSGDFRERTVDVVDGRLRLRASTLGTDPATVKHLGVRSVQPLHVGGDFDLAVELDWNGQANGCYMTAGIVLCPTLTDANPATEPDWFRVLYIGVPPGRNARAHISRRTKGTDQVLHAEGWPAERQGRLIGRQRLRLQRMGDRLTVHEHGEVLWSGDWRGAERAYLYLQMSSHSNYPPRQVFFDDVVFSGDPLGP